MKNSSHACSHASVFDSVEKEIRIPPSSSLINFVSVLVIGVWKRRYPVDGWNAYMSTMKSDVRRKKNVDLSRLSFYRIPSKKKQSIVLCLEKTVTDDFVSPVCKRFSSLIFVGDSKSRKMTVKGEKTGRLRNYLSLEFSDRTLIELEFPHIFQFEYILNAAKEVVRVTRENGEVKPQQDHQLPKYKPLTPIGTGLMKINIFQPAIPLFYLIPANKWQPLHFTKWMDHIFVAGKDHRNVVTLHEYMGLENISSRFWKHFMQLGYNSFDSFRREVDNHPRLTNPGLKEVFEDKKVYECFRREIRMLEDNNLIFDINFHMVMKKIIEDQKNRGKIFSDEFLERIRSNLFLKERFRWSVPDCLDHLISLLVFKKSFDDIVRDLEKEFFRLESDLTPYDVGEDERYLRIDPEKWSSVLEEFNDRLGFSLEDVSFAIYTFKGQNELRRKMVALLSHDTYEQNSRQLEELEEKILSHFPKPEHVHDEEHFKFLNSRKRKSVIHELLMEKFSSKLKYGFDNIPVRLGLDILKGFDHTPNAFVTKYIRNLKWGHCHSFVSVSSAEMHFFGNDFVCVKVGRAKTERYEHVLILDCLTPIIPISRRSLFARLNQISELIIQANVNWKFVQNQILGKKKNKMNNHEASTYLMEELRTIDFPPFVARYLKELKNKLNELKIQEMTDLRFLKITPEFSKIYKPLWKRNEKFRPDGRYIYFNSYQFLVEFMEGCLWVNEDMDVLFPEEVQLLKGFETAFYRMNENCENDRIIEECNLKYPLIDKFLEKRHREKYMMDMMDVVRNLEEDDFSFRIVRNLPEKEEEEGEEEEAEAGESSVWTGLGEEVRRKEKEEEKEKELEEEVNKDLEIANSNLKEEKRKLLERIRNLEKEHEERLVRKEMEKKKLLEKINETNLRNEEKTKEYELLERTREEQSEQMEEVKANLSEKEEDMARMREEHSILTKRNEEEMEKLHHKNWEMEEKVKTLQKRVKVMEKTAEKTQKKNLARTGIIEGRLKQNNLEVFKIENSNLEIDRDDFLGQGQFGKVYGGKMTFHRKIAGKEIQLAEVPKKDVMDEFKNQITLVHPNVLRTYGYSEPNQRCIQIVTEKIDMNLFEYIISRKLDLFQKYNLMFEMVKGLYFLHDQKPVIVHRDIKSLNFLCSKDGNEVKICDFGLVKAMDASLSYVQSEFKGTPRWMAPELFLDEPKYSVYSDIFALGMTFYEVLYEKHPYEGKSPTWLFRNVDKTRPSISDKDLPELFKELLKSMWEHDPKKRPNSDVLMEWFDEHEMEFIEKFGKQRFPK